mmetsp:Transcript_23367/g.50438  ORF Transcript_23367/g.50438 Transcript_23367/m.50438 type:complete len:126 (-) Transcript_23367:464-841(-)
MMRSLVSVANALRAPAFSMQTAILRRPIITVNVYNPLTRGDVSKENLPGEVARAEDMAVAQFNRLVRQEVEYKSIPAGGRRMKRLSRNTRPTQKRRLEAERGQHRSHMKTMSSFMSWIQYRRRRN